MQHLNFKDDKECRGCKYLNSMTYRQRHYYYCTWSGKCEDHNRYKLKG